MMETTSNASDDDDDLDIRRSEFPAPSKVLCIAFISCILLIGILSVRLV